MPPLELLKRRMFSINHSARLINIIENDITPQGHGSARVQIITRNGSKFGKFHIPPILGDALIHNKKNYNLDNLLKI